MKYEQQFSNLIHEYLLKRLQFGYYLYGDILPTVDVFCHEFNVSDHTIWAALRRLRTEGFITMKNGQATKVIYKQTEEERQNNLIDFFSERWDAYQDLYEAAEITCSPLMIEGLRRMDEQEKDYIVKLSKRASADDVILFYCYTLQKMENPLLMNLFWEISLFLGFPFSKPGPPFHYDKQVGREQFKVLVALIKAGSWDSVHKTLIQYQRYYVSEIIKCMGPKIRNVPKEKQISFAWRIYRDRPQICYNLASLLLHEIYMGEYRTTEFLPSYEKMAEKYEVSVSTMRRTIRMLNQIGAAQSINGRGTRIFTIGERSNGPDFTCPVVRRNLSYFIQSYELFSYTYENVSQHFIHFLDAEEREEIIARFEENQRTGLCAISILHYLLFIAKYSRSRAIRQISGITYSLFLWGYPLKDSIDSTPNTDRDGELFTESMINGLREKNTEQCVSAVRSYIQKRLPPGEEFLIQKGIESEELRIFPPIRLLLLHDDK